MAETTAVYRAIADFSALKRQADAARRSLRRLRDESSDTHQDYVEGQEEVTEATDDSTKSNVGLSRALAKVSKATRDTTQTEGSRVDVIKDTVAQIGKQSAAQRENTRLEVEANRAKEKLTLSTAKYQSVASDAAATDEDRAKALDNVRLSSIAAAAATDRLQSSMARLAVGGGGRGGRPRGPGIATDVGAFGRALATAGAGLLSTLLLVVPTINTIIAGVIGLVALLGTAVVAAAAFAAAFTAVGAAMAFAAFKWRDLLASSDDGVSEWRGAILAIEADAFNAFERIAAHFTSVGDKGASMWDSIVEGADTLINKMEPFFIKIGDFFLNIIDAASGVPGAFSPIVEFFKTWIDEWKVLQKIVSKDILPGGPGFFEKYEAPAKAFVEGIAQVINGIRKFSAMGLGLNMDQLAEFITNVFDALAKLIQIIPRYSNALVEVGLAASEWLDSLIPIIDAAITIGAAILQNIVAPLVKLAGILATSFLNLPVISFLASLAGGFAVAAFGISKLSFGLLKFKDIMTGALIRQLAGFIGLIKEFGFLQTAAMYFPTITKHLVNMGSALTAIGRVASGGLLKGVWAGLAGGTVVTAAIAAGFILVQNAMAGLAEIEQKTEKAWDSLMDRFRAGNATVAETRKQMIAAASAERERGSILGKMAWEISHAAASFTGSDRTEIFAEEANQRLASSYLEISQNATAALNDTGALTDEQVKGLKHTRDAAGGMQYFTAYLRNATKAYEDGIITGSQYVTILDQLGVSAEEAGSDVDVVALKVEGASNTISQSLLAIGEDARLATGPLEQFATAMGEDATAFARDAKEAFLDVQNGLLGTGTAVTDWFKETVDAIESWKNEVADSFDTVKEAIITLGSEADVSWDKFKKGIDDAIEAAHEMQDNITYILKHGASPLLEQLIAENGPALAGLYETLQEQGPGAIHEVNKALREGVDIGTSIAGDLADAMGIALEPLLSAVELFIAKLLDIPVHQVKQQVHDMVSGTNQELEDLKRIPDPTRRQDTANLYRAGLLNPAPTPEPKKDKGLDEKATREKYENIGRTGVAGGMAAGMAEGTPEVKAASRNLADATIKETKSQLQIASPSRVFISIGGAVMMGLAQGFKNGTTLIVNTLLGIRDQIVEVFTNASTWMGNVNNAFRTLRDLLNNDVVPAVDDLVTALENLPETIAIQLDLDTSKAEEAANTFLENMEKKGLIFQTPTGKQVLHEGGPAGHAGRFATGRPKSGEVDARLQKGEYVFSRKSVQSMGGLGEMESFHNFLQGKRLFHTGGPVDESEETSAKIRRLAESLGISGVAATGILPKQKMTPEVSVSAPGAGKVGGITAAAANYMATIKKNFPMITGYGTVAVRTIAGTNTWSQHAYGNAIDVMTGSSTALRQAVAFFSNQYRRILSIAHLLADPWFASPRGDHYNHVHADFFPQYGGTPPGQPYRAGGKVRKRGGRVHQNEFVLRESAANALGTGGLDFLNTHADRYGPAAFLEAFNRSFATTAMPRMGGVGSGADGGNGRAMFSIAMHLDGKTISKSVDVYSREADILLPGR